MAAQLLNLSGEIDLNAKPIVAAQLEPLIESKSPAIVVDLSKVSYVDSSGLAIFIDALQRVRSYGGKIALAGLRGNVRVVFEIAKLDRVFQIFDDWESAIKALG